MKYSVGFAFLTSEKNENFNWILHMFLDILNSKEDMPKVIVIDRDTSLMNAITTVFSKTTTVLCHFYIGKNVRAKCIGDCRLKPKDVKADDEDKEVKEVKASEILNNIMRAWTLWLI
jgi:hypothetical protein